MGVNVRDFGAIGDGSADDTMAIQAAYNSLIATGGICYIPPTSHYYRVTAPIQMNANFGVVWTGEGRSSRLIGNFPGFVFDRTAPNASDEGPFIMERLYVENQNLAGGGIRLSGLINSTLRDLHVAAPQGIIAENQTFTCVIQGVRVTCGLAGAPIGSVGIGVANHASLLGVDVGGFDVGLRLSGGSTGVQGGRIEMNRTGALFGMNAAGDAQAGGCFLRGTSFEANETGIYLYHVGGCEVSQVGIQGSSSSVWGQSKYGLRAKAMTATGVRDLTTNGGFSAAGVAIDNPPVASVFESVKARNALGPVWVLPGDLSGATFLQCNQA